MSPHTKNKKISKHREDFLTRMCGLIGRLYNRHAYLATFIILALYLVVFQPAFVFGGDSWAETFYEYVYGAVVGGWQEFFHVGIAGYFNFLPKLFSYSYVLLGAPVGYVDYFLRFVVIIYTLACVSFIAHPYNRHLIKNNALRLLLAFTTLLTFYHISSFSLINVWYVGFIPIILVSLHPNKFTHEWQEVLYAAFAMSVCLTKPSLVVLPLVAYRMIRHKEYLLGSIIIFGISLETLLFFTSSYYEQWTGVYEQHISFIKKIVNTLLYPGLLILKLYRLEPIHIAVVGGASALLGILFIALMKIRDITQTLLIGLTLCLVSYTAIYPPDTPPFSVVSDFSTVFHDEMKLQREVLISFLVVFVLFLVGSFIAEKYTSKRHPWFVMTGISCGLIILTGLSFRTIDVQSSKLHVNIDPFRTSLTKRDAICMPIPPTPSWYPKNTSVYGWYYESYGRGTCGKTNYDKTIDYASFGHKTFGNGQRMTIHNPHNHLIKTVYLPIYNPTPDRATTVILKDTKTGMTFEAPIESKKDKDMLTFVAFNLANGETIQQDYDFILLEKGISASNLSTGAFTDKSTALYSYFLPPELKHPKDR